MDLHISQVVEKSYHFIKDNVHRFLSDYQNRVFAVAVAVLLALGLAIACLVRFRRSYNPPIEPVIPLAISLAKPAAPIEEPPLTPHIDGSKKIWRKAKEPFRSKSDIPPSTEQSPKPAAINRKRSASSPIKAADDLLSAKKPNSFSSPELMGLKLLSNALSFNKLFKQINQLYQAQDDEDVIHSVGLSEAEIQKIDKFIASKEHKWDKKHFSWRRYLCGENGLPRTVDVFKDNGQLYIMVLCKKKGGMELLGKGTDRKAYVCVEWKTQTKFADLVLLDVDDEANKMAELHKESALAAEAAKGGNIARGLFGIHSYPKGGKTKIGFYMPLYEGRLDKLTVIKTELKPFLMADLLNGLASIKKAHLDHRDIKGDNVYIKFINGLPNLFIADFSCSCKFEAAAAEDKSVGKYEGVKGNDPYKPPEKIIVKKMRRALVAHIEQQISDLSKSYEGLDDPDATQAKKTALQEIKENGKKALAKFNHIIDDSWKQHDTWAVGILCLGLLALGRKDLPPDSTVDYYAYVIEKMVNDTVYAKPELSQADIAGCYSDIQQKVDQLLMDLEESIADPLEAKMLAIIKQLLQADPAKRISPQDALKLSSDLISPINKMS